MKIYRMAGCVLFTSFVWLLALGGGPAAWAQRPFHVEAKWKIGGAGGWDYLAIDPVSKLLYVTRGDHVIAIDTGAGKETNEIGGMQATHGIAFDNNGFGYISDGFGNQVVVFERKINRVIQAIPAGSNPDGIVFEPVTNTVWAFNGRSGNATVIRAKTQAAVAMVALPGIPEFPVADGKGSIFANVEDKSEIVHIDARSRKILAAWPLAPCKGPSGLSIDRVRARLFAVCSNKMMAVVDAATGKVVATPPIGERPDASAFSPQDRYVFSSNGGDGTLTVIHEDTPNKYTVVQNLQTQKGARTMAIAPDGKRIYLATADFGPVPARTANDPHPRAPILPGTFVILVVTR